MKTNFLKTSLFIFASLALFSCVNDDDYEIPNFECNDPNLTANKTVQDLYDMASATITQFPTNVVNEDILEAYVVSSDRGGNFFKSLSLQTLGTATTPPRGFSIPIDQTSMFTIYEPGRKVYVKLNRRYFNITNGSLIIGELFLNSGGNASVGRISASTYGSIVIRSCQFKDESELVRTLTVNEAKQDANLNTLIELDNVQFMDAAVGSTYFNPNNVIGGATNHLITDTNGNTVIFRTSSFATYAGTVVPGESGKIRGVMTKFGSDYQFFARTIDDVQLTNTRFDIDFAPPIVGNNIVFLSSLNENFESYPTTTPANRIFPSYINDPVVGSRYWGTTTFGGNKYIQMTSFGGTPENNRSLFIIPVDMGAANAFSFQTKAGFANGSVLKVYYSTDYVVGGNVNNATLVDITSSFTISAGQASGYPADFTNSGNFAIPASITGNGFFIFEYVGAGGGVTTTMQIDNIVIN
ncbi:DUF5689 domain-containing protein [Flavobacterium lacus]|jgi:hypothetical protein|uniref:DUF5689 domain-containing protein n=1 Tax=Flavobacterium lacus TaxID=1353778 RepID=A0A328WKH7_9FLAO|nr:DUF5689 domain-containing protein [Flavobacterium lacus]RAR46751.1 hypothetical protein B0I10_11560 [Flavobacterium lacus]